MSSRRSSANWRSPACFLTPSAAPRASSTVPGSIFRLSAAAIRAARRTRSGSSTRLRSDTARSTPAARSRAPALRIHQRRVERHERGGDRVDREVAEREVALDAFAAKPRDVDVPGPVRGQGPPGGELLPESWNLARRPPRRCASRRLSRIAGDCEVHVLDLAARARRRGSLRRRSRHRSSRRGPPGMREPRGRLRQAIGDRPRSRALRPNVDPRHPGRDPAGDLVVDRPKPPRHLLAEDPLVALRRRSARRAIRARRPGPARRQS